MSAAKPGAAPWPPAPRPSAQSVESRKSILRAVSAADPQVAKDALADPEDRVRSTALSALHQLGALTGPEIREAVADPSARVRRRLATIGAADPRVHLATLIADQQDTVCETACWAAGERSTPTDDLVPVLASIATQHDDALCRESAVAALGAIGSPVGLPAILAATKDRATVRRRAVLALAPFDTPEVTHALKLALEDRDWQVRQAAEDLLGPDGDRFEPVGEPVG